MENTFFSTCVYLAWDWICEDLKAEVIKVLFLIITISFNVPLERSLLISRKSFWSLLGALTCLESFLGTTTKMLKKKFDQFLRTLDGNRNKSHEKLKKIFRNQICWKNTPKSVKGHKMALKVKGTKDISGVVCLYFPLIGLEITFGEHLLRMI